MIKFCIRILNHYVITVVGPSKDSFSTEAVDLTRILLKDFKRSPDQYDQEGNYS